MDDRNDGIDMRSDFDRELDDMADKISKHGDDIIDRDDSNNRRQRRANRYDDDDMDSYSVQKRKRRASRYDDTDAYDDDCDDIAVHGTFSQRVGRACVNYWKNAFDYWAAAITYGIIMQMFNISYFIYDSTIIYFISVLLSLAMFIPSLSMVVRRLHDTDRSGFASFSHSSPSLVRSSCSIFCYKEAYTTATVASSKYHSQADGGVQYVT